MGGGGMGGGGMRSCGMGDGGCGRWRHGWLRDGWWTTSITNRMTSYKKDYGDHSICETTTKSCGLLPSNASSVSSSMSSSLSIYNNLYHNLFHATFQAAIVVKSLWNAYFQDQPLTTTNSKNDEESTSCMNNDLDEINTATTTNTTTNSSSIPSSNLPSSNILSSSSSRSMNFFESISRSWLPIPLQHNQYVVAHYRAKYPNNEPYRGTQNRTILYETKIYAIECAKIRIGSGNSSMNTKMLSI